MKTRRSKGAILVQVLIMGALLLILVTLLVKAVNQNFQLGSYVVGESRETKNSESTVAAVQDAWALASVGGSVQNCLTTVQPGIIITCTGTANTCGTCTGGSATSPCCTCTVYITTGGVSTRMPNVIGYPDVSQNCQLQTDLTGMSGLYTFP